MYLSKQAQFLLDEREIEALQQLSLKDLVNQDTLDYFKFEKPGQLLETYSSAPHVMRCPMTIETLQDPVVVSSGRIYSKQAVLKLFEKEQPGDPETSEPLDKNCMIELPVIVEAIANWKGEGLQTLSAKTVFAEEPSITLEVKVATDKIRILFRGETEALESTITSFLPNEASCINNLPQDASSYSCQPWGRVWRKASEKTPGQLEFWHPSKSLSDDELSLLFSTLLEDLNLAAAEEAPAEEFSIETLRPREYVTAIAPIDVSVEKAINLCTRFFEYTTQKQMQAELDTAVDECIPSFRRATSSHDKGPGLFSSGSSLLSSLGHAPASSGAHLGRK